MFDRNWRWAARGIGTAVLGVAMALCACGCEPAPVSQTQQNINTFTLAQQKTAEGKKVVGETMAALQRYCARPSLGAYTPFAEDARKAQQIRDQLRDIHAVLVNQTDAFFADWEKQIAGMSNPDLKNRTEMRKQASEAKFKQIDLHAPAASAAYDRFISDVNDLRSFFDYDKTESGVAAAASLVAKARNDGLEVQRQLDAEAGNLTSVKAAFVAMQRG